MLALSSGCAALPLAVLLLVSGLLTYVKIKLLTFLVATQRKTRTHVPNFADPTKKGEPRSFVFWRGKHGVRQPSAF